MKPLPIRVWYAIVGTFYLVLARLQLEVAFIRDPSLRDEWKRLWREHDGE